MKIEDKTILITGGASGIGLEAAKQFLSIGCKVIITGRNEQKLKLAKQKFPMLITIKSDVANEEDALSLLKQVSDLGGIDILYNNAGVSTPPINLGKPDPMHYDKATYEMNINYLGIIRLNNIFIDMLNSRKEPAIINTTSILSYVPANLAPTYSATKVALRFYTETLRSHLQMLNSDIKVFELLPPLVATEMAEGMDAKAIKPEQLVKGLITGLKNDNLTIRVGATKAIYFLSRFFPRLAFKLINPLKYSNLLK
ncbi:SDR family NAD(P)-dependent oxidoreductase [Chitinophaga sp. 212800010-3]|uniref:SDR family oxidoreductase n=1 Tax=unclassified Chitinophaga TaxID=2619133 RepID=UPI002DE23A93|nr:hypothetical protein [Chitinophaga sp. 212800010-3]